ncbi:hypothetical protein [Nocardioides jensenii]|uniref:hypothetical protein n=1 Tax=Nocardioides jensenii TaxID=1843 RepID=UPI0008341ABB|nr:hypothetical protein [Nocardioides jensenii]
MKLATLALCLLLALTSCGGSADGDGGSKGANTATPAATAESTPEPQFEKDAAYGTVQELHDAAVEAGYVCANWKPEHNVTLAAESGTCSDEDVFSTFASQGDLQSQLDLHREMNELLADADIDPSPMLVGSNWIINGDNAPALQSMLGGTVERFAP